MWWKLHRPRNAGQKGFHSDPHSNEADVQRAGRDGELAGCENANYKAQLIGSTGRISQRPQTPQGKATWPFSSSPGQQGDVESASCSEDWALHLTGGLSFYFPTAAANPWAQAKANTDAGLIYLGKVCRSLRRRTPLLPFHNADHRQHPLPHQARPKPTWEGETCLIPPSNVKAVYTLAVARRPGSNFGHLLVGDLGQAT